MLSWPTFCFTFTTAFVSPFLMWCACATLICTRARGSWTAPLLFSETHKTIKLALDIPSVYSHVYVRKGRSLRRHVECCHKYSMLTPLTRTSLCASVDFFADTWSAVFDTQHPHRASAGLHARVPTLLQTREVLYSTLTPRTRRSLSTGANSFLRCLESCFHGWKKQSHRVRTGLLVDTRLKKLECDQARSAHSHCARSGFCPQRAYALLRNLECYQACTERTDTPKDRHDEQGHA